MNNSDVVITVYHNGWEHGRNQGKDGWTCCAIGICNCGAQVQMCACGLHFTMKTSRGIVVG